MGCHGVRQSWQPRCLWAPYEGGLVCSHRVNTSQFVARDSWPVPTTVNARTSIIHKYRFIRDSLHASCTLIAWDQFAPILVQHSIEPDPANSQVDRQFCRSFGMRQPGTVRMIGL